uniref:DNA-directed RNA polymerase D subunit 1 n=1 Tax=Lygus hesperus TaxID=30085 RepID=A0A0A9W2D2_LYGHE
MASKNKRQRLVFSEKLMYSFINDYKESSCLWDIKNPDYKCAEKRRTALATLAAKYDVSEEEAKKKINSLRSTYLQEKKKVEESKRANSGEIYEPSLYWYHELEFLYDVIIPRKTPHPCAYNTSGTPSSPIPEQCHVITRDQSSEVINQEVDQEHLIFEFVPDGNEKTIFAQKLDPSAYVAQGPSLIAGRKLRGRPSKKPSVPQPVHQQHLADQMEVPPPRLLPHDRQCHSPQPLSHIPHEDEFDTFCCSIASQLRTLPPADAIEMQLEIQQLVSRRRLAVLKNQQNLSLFRTWESTDSYHQYHPHNSPMDNVNVQEERGEKIIMGQ